MCIRDSLDSEFLFNPAHLGKSDDVVFMANYQKQFSKFDESPNIQSVGLHANVFDRVGAGAYFFRDQNGPISANGIALGASYFIPLSDEDGRKAVSYTHLDVYKRQPSYLAS